jgi:hypothetical protein
MGFSCFFFRVGCCTQVQKASTRIDTHTHTHTHTHNHTHTHTHVTIHRHRHRHRHTLTHPHPHTHTPAHTHIFFGVEVSLLHIRPKGEEKLRPTATLEPQELS